MISLGSKKTEKKEPACKPVNPLCPAPVDSMEKRTGFQLFNQLAALFVATSIIKKNTCFFNVISSAAQFPTKISNLKILKMDREVLSTRTNEPPPFFMFLKYLEV